MDKERHWIERVSAGEKLSPHEYPEVRERLIKRVREGMEESGLLGDARNILNRISLAQLVDITRLEPAEQYEEYLRSKDIFADHVESELAIAMSNPDAMKELNSLIREFNQELGRIIEERDEDAVQTFIARGVEIFEKHKTKAR